jgi:hypothetical protein
VTNLISASQWGTVAAIIDPTIPESGLGIVVPSQTPITLTAIGCSVFSLGSNPPYVRLFVVTGSLILGTVSGFNSTVQSDPTKAGLPLNTINALGFTNLYEHIIPAQSVYDVGFGAVAGVGPYVADGSGISIYAIPLISGTQSPYYCALTAYGITGAPGSAQAAGTSGPIGRSVPRGVFGY